jgi:hypothetical protein
MKLTRKKCELRIQNLERKQGTRVNYVNSGEKNFISHQVHVYYALTKNKKRNNVL